MVTREGLRRRALVGLRSALRDGNFVDLVQRLSGGAVSTNMSPLLVGSKIAGTLPPSVGNSINVG